MVVFLPIAFLSGIVGKFMVEFGIVVVVATLFSLLVSFTLTPMLAARWSVKKRSAAPPKALAWFQVAFDRFTLWYRDVAFSYIIRHRWMVVFVCVLLLINAIVLPASAFIAAIGIDVAAIAIALVWMLLGPLLYALGNRVGGDARRVFRSRSARRCGAGARDRGRDRRRVTGAAVLANCRRSPAR